MNTNREDESVCQEPEKPLEKPRLPYHAPRLVCLGPLHSLVHAGLGTGSDANNDCSINFG